MCTAINQSRCHSAGVDSLEHASLLSDETIALAVEHDVALSMDIYNGTYTDSVGRELGYPDVFIQRNFDTTEAQRNVFEKAVATGATLLYEPTPVYYRMTWVDGSLKSWSSV